MLFSFFFLFLIFFHLNILFIQLCAINMKSFYLIRAIGQPLSVSEDGKINYTELRKDPIWSMKYQKYPLTIVRSTEERLVPDWIEPYAKYRSGGTDGIDSILVWRMEDFRYEPRSDGDIIGHPDLHRPEAEMEPWKSYQVRNFATKYNKTISEWSSMKLPVSTSPNFPLDQAILEAEEKCEALCNTNSHSGATITTNSGEPYNFRLLLLVRWKTAIEDMYGGTKNGWRQEWNEILNCDNVAIGPVPSELRSMHWLSNSTRKNMITAVEETLMLFKRRGIRLMNISDREVLERAAEISSNVRIVNGADKFYVPRRIVIED